MLTEEDKQWISTLVTTTVNTAVDAAASNLTQLIVDVKSSLEREIANLGKRIALLEQRMDRMATRLSVIEFQLAGIQRAMSA